MTRLLHVVGFTKLDVADLVEESAHVIQKLGGLEDRRPLLTLDVSHFLRALVNMDEPQAAFGSGAPEPCTSNRVMSAFCMGILLEVFL